jgi:UDP-N-acetylglucosamine 2-epimerase (non-hydrolysing)
MSNPDMTAGSILLCVGTRPEIIKMAPVYYALKQAGMEPLLLHTGQHEDMADPMYRFFKIVPDYSLNLSRTSDSLYHLSSLLLDSLGAAFDTVKPTAVLVHGDTSSAAMAALAAFYQRIPVGHVEAGLRSHTHYDPFPEEKNRELIGRLAHWHFAPTARARRNLLNENIPEASIHMVGNTVVDAVRMAMTDFHDTVEHADDLATSLKTLPAMLNGRRLLFVTAHRRENLGKPLLEITATILELLNTLPDLVVVWPVHSNPKIRTTVDEAFADLPPKVAERLYLTKPLGYPTTLNLLSQAWMALTDSGGIQEEAACMHLPVLILRETTERPELVENGGGLLTGTERERVVAEVRRLSDNPEAYQTMRNVPNPFGDGYSAARIRDILSRSNNAI